MTVAVSHELSDETAHAGAPAFLTRVRLRARRTIAWLHRLWASSPGALGLAISPHEVNRILDGEHRDDELAFYATEARELTAAIAHADAAFVADPQWARLRSELWLDDAELDLLSLAAAVEADPWLRRAFAYIHDDATSVFPTPWLARQLFQWAPGVRIGSDSRLVRWQLARPIDQQPNPWSATTSWVADSLIASALIGEADVECGADGVRMAMAPPSTCLYPDELATVVAFVRALGSSSAPIEVVIAAPSGGGKRTLATAICAELAMPLLIVDCPALVASQPDVARRREAVVQILRSARLSGAAVYWHELDDKELEMRAAPPPRVTFIGTTRALRSAADDGVVRRTVRLPQLTRAERARLWSALSSREVPSPVLDWSLLPSDIARAATVAPAGTDAIVEACRNTTRIDAGALATRLARPYSWDDLVVPGSVRRHLEELEAQVRLRWSVYEDWGFGKFFPMGRGIAALFAGPSGTGKTMSVQVLANALEMELYRVDLAGVMSKYIGETEKNLREVFDACERANVLLFFDEADALFGQRMQVKDAHDRFANIEIDYLLQRMEQFDGLAVLATNRKNEIDSAFLRRVRFIVDFLPPGVGERRELWTRALPSVAPNGDELLRGIDVGVLAERLEMTGAEIKNAATSAAFLARGENSPITPQHVFRAARRELAKRGVVLRGEME